MSYRRGPQAGRTPHSNHSTHANIFGSVNDGDMRKNAYPSRKHSKEETEQRPARKTSGRKAPNGVPRLALDSMIDDENANGRQSHETHMQTQPPPVTVSVVSPSRQPRKRSGELSSGRPKKHDFVPNLELDLSASSDALQAMREAAEDVYRDITIEYADTALRSAPIQSKNHLSNQRKQQFVEETLLADQLGGVSISKPRFHRDQQAGRQGNLHQSILTSDSSHGNDLSKRLRFGARILTGNDRDALRELNGFFFAGDGSLTMYEFRQFGTRSNALPFISRGRYTHMHGQKKEQPLCLLDIYLGSELSFETKLQSSLPDNLRQEVMIHFIVTEIDESAKEKLLYDGCQGYNDRAARADWAENYQLAKEDKKQVFVRRIQKTTQAILAKRNAAKTLIGLRKHLQNTDKSGSGVVSSSQLMAALKKFRLDISVEDLEWLCNSVGEHGGAAVDIYRFTRQFVGGMSESRRSSVRRAFMKMDHAKNGIIRSTELARFYMARNHPAVIAEQKTENEERMSLLALFADTQISGEIKYSEFEDYCEGISLALNKDEKFLSFMQQMWGI